MFTRNWYKAIKAACHGYGNTGLSAVNTSGKTVTLDGYNNLDMVGSVFPGVIKALDYIQPTGGSGGLAGNVYFGTGTTPPTLDDYKLENGLLTTQITFVSSSSVRTIKKDTVICEYTYVILNKSSNEITIGEIGLGGTAFVSGGSGYGILIERTVLENPVTIPVGESRAITYTLEWKVPIPPDEVE